jgi:hypothetical protein
LDKATPDSVWIPQVAARGWLIITRDRSIQDHRAELQAVVRNGARMVALAGKEAVTTWDQLEVVMSQWRKIEALFGDAPPLVRTATRTTLSPVDLSGI